VEKSVKDEQSIRQFLKGMYGARGPKGELAFDPEKGVLVENLPVIGESRILNGKVSDSHSFPKHHSKVDPKAQEEKCRWSFVDIVSEELIARQGHLPIYGRRAKRNKSRRNRGDGSSALFSASAMSRGIDDHGEVMKRRPCGAAWLGTSISLYVHPRSTNVSSGFREIK
jgi:hypothetical protein